jgi:hypothetical protein
MMLNQLAIIQKLVNQFMSKKAALDHMSSLVDKTPEGQKTKKSEAAHGKHSKR